MARRREREAVASFRVGFDRQIELASSSAAGQMDSRWTYIRRLRCSVDAKIYSRAVQIFSVKSRFRRGPDSCFPVSCSSQRQEETPSNRIGSGFWLVLCCERTDLYCPESAPSLDARPLTRCRVHETGRANKLTTACRTFIARQPCSTGATVIKFIQCVASRCMRAPI